jgi:predicted transcriptional regulator
MAEKKAVLNITVSESVAARVRAIAAVEGTTISSVVERALADELRWELKRREGLAAFDAYYREHGYPTPEEVAEAEAQVADEHRLIEEARAVMAAQRQRGSDGS